MKAPTTCPAGALKPAGNDGASRAATGASSSSSQDARSSPLRYALAFWEQTSVQLPQAMQRSSTTNACPSSMRMASAGQSRTQV